MSSLNKYRVHEVAKDFDMPSKDVMTILTDYMTVPKNHMQALTDEELNVVFEVITQNNQIDNLEQVFAQGQEKRESDLAAAAAAAAAARPETVAPDPAAPAAPAAAAGQQGKPPVHPHPGTHQPAPQQNRVASFNQGGQKTEPSVRVIDTRGASVDLARYDERVDRLVPDRAQNMNQGKEKIKRVVDKRGKPPFSQKRRQEEQEKMRRLQIEMQKKQPIKVIIPDEIAVGELASRMKKTGAEVVKQLMKLGVMASVSEVIDYDTAALVAMEMGAKVEREVVVTIEEKLIDATQDAEENLELRDPVVVVMGHVDHGKTSLLDAIRKTNVVAGEAGGITQHIGAYRVSINGRDITFLDTPGHEAFTSMRARGAQVTDIAILVVAAEDGIMPQTIEAIHHAKAAQIPVIVAINKMDKPDANPDRIKQQLTEYELVSEEWGGDTIVCPISAISGMGIDHLLEMVLLTADMRDLRANPNRAARGTVIEAKLDRGRGAVTTVLVQNGTLKLGDIIIAGKSVGRVRAMTDDKGRKIEQAGPSVPVEISGLAEVPGAGDLFFCVADERMARELAEQRKQQEKDEQSHPNAQKVSLEELYAQIQEGQIKELGIIVKADVQGSAEAVRASLEKITSPEVRVKVIHSGVGAISESDILLASASNAIVVGFNVRPDPSARENADRMGVDVRLYRIIYDCIQEMEAAMKGMLAPKYREVALGRVEVRQVFKVSDVGTIAGCYVLDGKISRSASVRLVRDGVVIHEGALASLKRFKEDAREVAAGYECGVGIERFNDIKEGDIIEAFTIEQIKV